MKRSILVVLGNLVLFYLIRILSVFIAFGFGIGASASSSKYNSITDIIDILIQLTLMLVIVQKKKWGLNFLHFGITFLVIVILEILIFFELMP